MSRIGRAPIVVPDKVEVKVGRSNAVEVKGGNKANGRSLCSRLSLPRLKMVRFF